MIAEFIVLGTIWFWLLCGGFFGLLLWAVEEENGFWATVLVAAFIATLYCFSSFNPLAWVMANLVLIGYGVAAYVGVGVVWSFVKWFFFVLRIAEAYGAAKKIIENEWEKLTDKSSFADFDSYSAPRIQEKMRFKLGVRYDDALPPQALDNKARILMWMMYWPASALWTVINDPIRRLFNFVYRHLSGTFQAISNAVFARHGWTEKK